MRKNFISSLAFFILLAPAISTFAASATTKTKQSATTLLATEKQGLSNLSIEQILAISPKKYQQETGLKMSFKEKLGLRFVQKNIKRDLKKNKSVDLKDYFDEEGGMRFNLGGFALGLLLGLLGVAIAHIFSNNKSFRKSSWIGFGVLAIVIIIASASLANNF